MKFVPMFYKLFIFFLSYFHDDALVSWSPNFHLIFFLFLLLLLLFDWQPSHKKKIFDSFIFWVLHVYTQPYSIVILCWESICFHVSNRKRCGKKQLNLRVSSTLHHHSRRLSYIILHFLSWIPCTQQQHDTIA